MTDTELLKAVLGIEVLAQVPYYLPCGVDCKYPNCKDEMTDYGKNCMELKLMSNELNRNFIAIEIDKKYYDLSLLRLKTEQTQQKLF